MSNTFTLPGGFIVAEVDLSPQGIYGTGSIESPLLIVNLRMNFRCPKDQSIGCLDYRELRCRLSVFDSTHIGWSLPTHLRKPVRAGEQWKDDHVLVQFPLDKLRLDLVNRLRKGGDINLRFSVDLDADELVQVGEIKDKFRPWVWGLRERHQLHSDLSVVIPRSHWVERVLPGTGCGQVHFIELPAIAVETCEGMKASFEALKQAQKLESEGYYDEAVGKCRIALEPFFEYVDKPNAKGEKKKVPVLKASWETRLGKATYDWLNASLVAVKQATNEAHHLSSSSFGQMEAKMVITVTTALVAYAVKTQPEDS